MFMRVAYVQSADTANHGKATRTRCRPACYAGMVRDERETETACSASDVMQPVSKKMVCNDKGGTNRVGCLCRPCAYAIVKRTTGVV